LNINIIDIVSHILFIQFLFCPYPPFPIFTILVLILVFNYCSFFSVLILISFLVESSRNVADAQPIRA